MDAFHSAVLAVVAGGALALPAPAPPPATLEGYWAGTAAVGAEQTPFALRIDREGGQLRGRIDLPAIGVLGWPAQVTLPQGAAIRVEFASDRGLNVLTGRVASDSLQGHWAMAGEDAVAVVSIARSTPPPAPHTDDVAFQSGTITLRGTILMPQGEGPWPGVVFVHGAGDESRDASRFLATHYAQHGIASLIYDKRGVGQSGGDWHAVGFDALAEDVLAGVEVLRQRAGIDPSAVGVRGQSQGGWIAPLAASRSRNVAFVITAAGPLVTPAEEGHWDAVFALRNAGHDAGAVAEAEALLAQRDEAVRTGTWDTFRTALTKAQQRSWFKASGVSSDVDPDSWIWEWYRPVMDFDPVPVFEGLTVPVLAQFGAHDESVPAEKSAAILEGIRDKGRKPFTIVVYPTTNHAMREVAKGPAFHWPAYVGGFLDDQVEWILGRATIPGVRPTVAGGTR